MPWFRRRPADPAATAARAAFGELAIHVDAAQRALLAAIPSARDPGVPLAQALAEFGTNLARAIEAVQRWPQAHEGTRCRIALDDARAQAERLRLGPEPSDFEALNARIGDVLHPLDVLADVERALRRA